MSLKAHNYTVCPFSHVLDNGKSLSLRTVTPVLHAYGNDKMDAL